ncbi:MAG: PhoU domain-containing protein, partial [Lentisphaerota bacterium]
LGAAGTHIEARRAAYAHLFFNLIAVTIAAIFSPFFIKFTGLFASDLIHQTANLHTTIMAVGTVCLLPFTRLFIALTRFLVRSRTPPPEPSFLDDKLIDFPEQALFAAIKELQRVTRICSQSFHLTAEIFFEPARHKVRIVRMNENVVDDIKKAMKSYLRQVTTRKLSRRQAILSMHLNRCITDLERIGDHIEELCTISERRADIEEARFDYDTLELIFSIYKAAEKVLLLVIDSLVPENRDIQAMAEQILAARNNYMEKSLAARNTFTEKIASHTAPPIQGIFFNEYMSCYDRIVKHAKTIALLEKQPYFWIKHKKMRYISEEAPEYNLPPPVDPQDFLDKLSSENYL